MSDYDIDPIGFLKRQCDENTRIIQEERDRRAYTSHVEDARVRYQQDTENLRRWGKQAVKEFSDSTPDYHDALQYLLAQSGRRLERAGLTHTEINQHLAEGADKLFAVARQTGVNPAKLIYESAIDQGYTSGTQWIDRMTDEQFDKHWEAMTEADRHSRYYGPPRTHTREGIPIKEEGE